MADEQRGVKKTDLLKLRNERARIEARYRALRQAIMLATLLIAASTFAVVAVTLVDSGTHIEIAVPTVVTAFGATLAALVSAMSTVRVSAQRRHIDRLRERAVELENELGAIEPEPAPAGAGQGEPPRPPVPIYVGPAEPPWWRNALIAVVSVLIPAGALIVGAQISNRPDPPDCTTYSDHLIKLRHEYTPEELKQVLRGLDFGRYERECGFAENILPNTAPASTTVPPTTPAR